MLIFTGEWPNKLVLYIRIDRYKNSGDCPQNFWLYNTPTTIYLEYDFPNFCKHDNVMTWKRFPYYWLLQRRIHLYPWIPLTKKLTFEQTVYMPEIWVAMMLMLPHSSDIHVWRSSSLPLHHFDVIMSTMTSQITSLTIVYSTVYSGAVQRKHQSSASLAFVRGIHRWPVNSPHKGPVSRKMFSFDGVIMIRIFAILQVTSHVSNIKGWLRTGGPCEPALMILDSTACRPHLFSGPYIAVERLVDGWWILSSMLHCCSPLNQNTVCAWYCVYDSRITSIKFTLTWETQHLPVSATYWTWCYLNIPELHSNHMLLNCKSICRKQWSVQGPNEGGKMINEMVAPR